MGESESEIGTPIETEIEVNIASEGETGTDINIGFESDIDSGIGSLIGLERRLVICLRLFSPQVITFPTSSASGTNAGEGLIMR